MQIELAKKEVCLLHLKFSLQSVGFLLFHFPGLFPFLVFTCYSAGKESDCHVGALGLTPKLRRSPGEGKGYHSGLESSMDCIFSLLGSQNGKKESKMVVAKRQRKGKAYKNGTKENLWTGVRAS